MNRLDLRNLVKESTGRTDKDSLINSALDLAVSKVSAVRKWSQLKVGATAALAVSTSNVTLATDAVRLSEFRVLDGTSSYKLLIRSKEVVVARFPDVASMSDSRPFEGYLEGKILRVVPEADKAYTIAYSYYRLHPRLATDSDILLIDAADAAVVAYASYWTLLSGQRREDATVWLAIFRDELTDAIEADRVSATDILLRPFNETRPVPPDFFLDPFVRRTPGF